MHVRLLSIFNWLISPMPVVHSGKFRLWYLRRCGVLIGKGTRIQQGVIIRGGGALVIGENSTIRSGAVIECGSRIYIGNRTEVNHGTLIAANCGSYINIEDDVHIAHNVSLKGSTHLIDVEGISIAGESVFKDIHIKRGSWLCAGCIVLPGVTVGARNVVAAGAVVTKDSPDCVLLCGVPARIKKCYT